MEVYDSGMDDIDRIQAGGLVAMAVRTSRIFFLQSGGPWRERVSVALGGWERCRPDYVVKRDRYPYHVVELVVGGVGRVKLDGVAHKLEAGVCFAFGPRTACEIETDAEAPLEKFFFALAGPGVTKALAAAGLGSGGVRRSEAPGELREVAELLVREGRRHGAAAGAVCARLAEVFLLKLGEPRGSEGVGGAGLEAARANFERCVALIDRHAAEWQSLADVAVAAGMDGSSVCRLFRRFMGETPHRYLRRRRMMLAAAWLVEHGGRVQDAAARVGMHDVFHFSRVFKAVHGVPPSALLAARR